MENIGLALKAYRRMMSDASYLGSEAFWDYMDDMRLPRWLSGRMMLVLSLTQDKIWERGGNLLRE